MRTELEKVLHEAEKVITGKREVIRKILTAFLADGHILLDDVPGVGKTTLAVALSRAMGVRFQRVQFTPDVLPSDLTGFSMMDKARGGFVYHPGALSHANLLLGDEINRASSKTQSALLEAMEERQVTVDGTTYPLERPFWVIATENSVGTAGTQFLPYAQMDRFLVRLSLGYPDYEAQMNMLRDRQGADPLDEVQCAAGKPEEGFNACRGSFLLTAARKPLQQPFCVPPDCRRPIPLIAPRRFLSYNRIMLCIPSVKGGKACVRELPDRGRPRDGIP